MADLLAPVPEQPYRFVPLPLMALADGPAINLLSGLPAGQGDNEAP